MTWSKADCASRIEPSPARAISRSASSETFIFSSSAMWRRRSAIFCVAMVRNSNCWLRERMVSGTLCGCVVAMMKRTRGGGSSKVFNRALKAAGESMCTSSMMKTL
jgi:hypothetical protein